MNGEENGKKYYGRYTGTVVNNIDPLKKGRLQVQVPDVLGGDPCIWADSASPIAGKQMGMFALPLPNDGVWVEFLDGDPDHAVWTGSWRGSSTDMPVEALSVSPTNPPIILQSIAQNKIIISSIPGEGIILQTIAGDAGPSIKITANKIVLSTSLAPGAATIELVGNQVTINNGALVIQ